ncbi:hypothetical protein L6452_14724 [Arctium lappa]|uniref:Uncharacterized protein n=1 Tax=Arctium lappa TaxID=4217 RepID=A0ACB9CLR2_ARCLA|nr:hypothetical protein L6452_14724 [Arctium lappa]
MQAEEDDRLCGGDDGFLVKVTSRYQLTQQESAKRIDKHYDFAVLIWNEQVDVVTHKAFPKKAIKFIPFQRFLQIIIQSMMDNNKHIPRRETTEKGPGNSMLYLKLSKVQFPMCMTIPVVVLAYEDQGVECVAKYVSDNALTVQPASKGPTNSATHASVVREGIETRNEQGQG